MIVSVVLRCSPSDSGFAKFPGYIASGVETCRSGGGKEELMRPHTIRVCNIMNIAPLALGTIRP